MKVLNFDSKQCERIRRQLDAYLSNELLVETTGEVLKHLESCAGLFSELETRTRVREALQKAVAREMVPEPLRQAIHQRLEERTTRAFLGISRVRPGRSPWRRYGAWWRCGSGAAMAPASSAADNLLRAS